VVSGCSNQSSARSTLFSESENFSLSHGDNLKMETVKCNGCPQNLTREEMFACQTCSSFPLCGKCILHRHLNPCRAFNVKPQFNRRTEILASMFTLGWKSRAIKVKTFKILMEASLSDINESVQLPLSTHDLKFQEIIESSIIDPLRDHYQNFIVALHRYEVINYVYDGMIKFTSGEPIPNMADMDTVALYEGWNGIKLIRDVFELMKSPEKEQRLHQLIANVEKSKNLLKTMVCQAQPQQAGQSEMAPTSRRRCKLCADKR